MATEKNIQTRIQHKHDIEANWLKATNFIPKAGELIIYDVDATHTEPRLKIGNGTTIVNNLPFAGDNSNATDTKVTQNAAITTAGEYPVILGNTTSIAEITDAVNKTSTLKYNPSTKVLTAPTFRGGLTTNSNNIILTESTNYSTTLPTSGVEGQLYFLEDDSPALPTGGSAGQVLVKNSATDGDASWTTNISGNAATSSSCTGNAATATIATKVNSSATTSKIYMAGVTAANGTMYYNTGVYASGSVLYGAAWNDYAEYRICKEDFIPGQVVCENGDDTLSIATERLQSGANVVSDTFGFAIGETDEAKCPIAVSGRVLAYTYEPREDFKPGDAVCAGPNGTVSKMTREEIREYPERIIGTVSAIPSYETWGTGNVKINNRIWIKI